MHGLTPGRELITNKLDTVFSLIFAHLLGAFIACSLGLWLARYLAKITVVPSKLLVPVLSLICLIGAYTSYQRIEDVYIAIIFALFGYMMIKCNIPRVPVILGLVLGPLIERSYQVSMQLSDGSFMIFFTRPYSVIFMLMIPLSLLLTSLYRYWRIRSGHD